MQPKMNILCFLAFGLSIAAGFRIHVKDELTKSCVKCHETDPNKLNVHLVHHSHDDVGWLKTLDQYFWGLKSDIVNVGVQYIISSVVNALWEHPERRFIQVETAFFWKWWNSQDDFNRNKFRKLVENGQLEIINGGWVMNDEACVNYQSTIDQFTWGFRILNDTLGECGNPTIGWQIDPFGHSREHASILSKMGFDGLFFARLDNNDREKRKKDQSMDFLWKTSANDDDSVIFGGMFGSENIYYPPSGFCFDVLCGDDSIDDDPEDDAYNLDAKVKEFADDVKGYAKYFKTNNVLVTMGGDFQYQAAEINFANSDKLIRAFENHTDLKLIYSTPSCYLKAVYEAQPELVTKTDDFFPYGSTNNSYWAGYFTSRQNFKRFERISHNTLQVSKQLTALAGASGRTQMKSDLIKGLREAIGVVQHHDAITGTEKADVAKDYTKILARAVQRSEEGFTSLIGELLDIDISAYTNLTSCLLANVSICSTTQTSDKFIVIVYNPLSWPVSHVVRLPVEDGSFTIQGPDGNVLFDVINAMSDFAYVKLENVAPATFELVFVASEIPPLGIKTYLVTKTAETYQKTVSKSLETDLIFGNEDIGFEIDSASNLLKSVTMNGVTIPVTQQFLHYTSHNGTNDTDPSGAYIFRPVDEAIPFDNPKVVHSFKSDIVHELQQRYNDWITQIIRVYPGSQNYIEFDWLVGPLNITDLGIEIITRFTVDNFKNNQTFYTDSNGREMIERKLNYRPTYSYNSSFEPVASNYYPVTSKILIRDEEQKLQVAVLNERSQGGSSLDEGQIELMVHRRTVKDDNKGVGEALNETEFGQGIVARGQHYLILGPSSETLNDGKTVTAQERIVAQQKLLQPWLGVGDASGIPEAIQAILLNKTYSGLKKSLPESVNILTWEPWTDSSYLLRVEHILEKNEDSTLSASTTVDLADLFAEFKITNITEMTLGANRRLASMKTKYDWTYKGDIYRDPQKLLSGTTVVLSPMDIKTFIVEVTK